MTGALIRSVTHLGWHDSGEEYGDVLGFPSEESALAWAANDAGRREVWPVTVTPQRETPLYAHATTTWALAPLDPFNDEPYEPRHASAAEPDLAPVTPRPGLATGGPVPIHVNATVGSPAADVAAVVARQIRMPR